MTAVTLTLTDFLLARIAEDEEVAKQAKSDSPRWASTQKDGTLKIDTGIESMGWEFGGGDGIWSCDDPYDDCGTYVSHAFAEGDHIARHDPARVLAECEAKRRIVEEHSDGGKDWDGQRFVHWCRRCAGRRGHEPWPCPTLRALALPYADHPDYRQEWRP